MGAEGGSPPGLNVEKIYGDSTYNLTYTLNLYMYIYILNLNLYIKQIENLFNL